jgi:hypothetical protein
MLLVLNELQKVFTNSFLIFTIRFGPASKMAVKRNLAEPSNDQIRKKNKVDGTITVEKFKVSMLNGSSKSDTVVLGTKIFDVTLLGSMVDILLRPLPAYDFIKEDGEEECAVYSINFSHPFSEEEMRLLVTKLDLNGAAAVFYGDGMGNEGMMKGWEKRNSTPETVFSQVELFVEMSDLHLLKRRSIFQIAQTMLLVLNEGA